MTLPCRYFRNCHLEQQKTGGEKGQDNQVDLRTYFSRDHQEQRDNKYEKDKGWPFHQGEHRLKPRPLRVSSLPHQKTLLTLPIVDDNIGDSLQVFASGNEQTEVVLEWPTHKWNDATNAVLREGWAVGKSHFDMAVTGSCRDT